MQVSLLKTSHEDLFLDQGFLLALGFYEGWACFRVQHKEWANLEPWSLGAVDALGNLSAYDEIQDTQSRHYLEPHDEALIYHSFWGVTPTRARIYVQYPPRADIGSILAVPRSETGNVGYIDGNKSPFTGPFSTATELFTVKEKYPQVQAYNPLNDDMYNVMLNFDQRHYSYIIIKDENLIKSMLIGATRVKKYTMGPAWPNAMTLPTWLKDAIGSNLLKYSLKVVAEGGSK
ncbi:unnamed protein product [marine sediment metagenome]|uniref:Uncharacterized protein n=1 Tax=marine sediment metagenome TaxID=412755 RepID=X1M5U9_9ZZZZ